MNSRFLDRQRRSFDSLVESGVYSNDFDHTPAAKGFVGTVLRQIAPRLSRPAPLKVLDCGCGTGAWLAFIHEQLSQAGIADLRLCGFDLSERMVEVAREKLRGLAEPADIRSGNVLEPRSYGFPSVEGGFDLIFTYDVIQQLPLPRQVEACFAIAAALSPGGVALIFDNDAATRFGRGMAMRKLLTRYFGLPLVPRYYCNAAYPPLERFRGKLDAETALNAEIIVRADGVKRALIVERRGPTAAPGETQTVEGRVS